MTTLDTAEMARPSITNNNAPTSLEQMMAMSCHTTEAITEMELYAQQVTPVLPEIALSGELTIINAQWNTGKTLLTLWLLQNRDRIATENMEIFYINADDSYNGGIEKAKLIGECGAKVFIPSQGGFSVSMFHEMLDSAIKGGYANRVVFILDTLKKFVSTMDKRAAREFNGAARKFTQAGGTLIALAHTNKHKDGEGRSVAEGVGDFHSDFDCAFTIELDEQLTTQDTKVVHFINDKNRGPVESKVTFSYSIEEGLLWTERLESVRKLSGEEIKGVAQQVKHQAQLELDSEIINDIREKLSVRDNCSRTELTKVGVGSLKARSIVLDRYSDELWKCRMGATGGKVYSAIN